MKVTGNLAEQHRNTALNLTLACNELRNKLQHLENLNNQLKETVKQQTASLNKESSHNERLSEENNALKRQLEHYTKFDSSASNDEALRHELNYYKVLF